MATVLLLRHGRTTANAGGTLAGHLPTELDDLGRAQAAAVGARLAAAGLKPQLVLSSPLLRCRQTLAEAMPEADVVEEPRLIEPDYGDWTGQALGSLAKQPMWQVVQVHPSAAVFPGGESMAGMAARAVAAIREADARTEAEYGPQAMVLACSHGDVIKAIVADAIGLHLDLFQRIAVEPGSLTVIRYTPHRPFLIRLNDIGGDLSSLRPQPVKGRRARKARSATDRSDAAVGGGSGGMPAPDAAPSGHRGDAGAADRIGS